MSSPDDASQGLPLFTDLRAVADRLIGDDRYAGLAACIKRAARTQSCASDLQQAQGCVDALVKVGRSARGYKSAERDSTENALMMHALQLYARATDLASKMGDRGSVSIAAKLTPEQLEDHQALVTIRSRAAAHVHVGEQIHGETWHDGLLFAIKKGPGWLPAHATQSTQYDEKTAQRLRRQVPVALAIMVARFHEQFATVTAKLNDPPVPEKLYLACSFDPVGVFGTAADVQKMITDEPGAARTTMARYPHRRSESQD